MPLLCCAVLVFIVLHVICRFPAAVAFIDKIMEKWRNSDLLVHRNFPIEMCLTAKGMCLGWSVKRIVDICREIEIVLLLISDC